MITFSMLRHGDRDLVEIYRVAHNMWAREFEREWHNVSQFADRLGTLQMKFEHELSMFNLDRWEAQEIFVISALTHFDDDTRSGSQQTEMIREAFELSFCSIEVKGFSRRISKALYLGGY
ncbi:hypothetical protein HJ122_23805 [Vibrio parahaemolyticus]|nr:hypothetical protein [Vibrio parahaemolyticus]